MATETARHGTVSRQDARIWNVLAFIRILIGLEFLWAFLDKTFGLGFATPPENAWINGGSPTLGYLSAERALEGVFQPLAGLTVIDVLFMLGLLGVGIGLTFGVAVWVSSIVAALMLLLMWLASFPIGPNPFIDYHLIEAVVVLVFPLALSHQRLSLAGPWQRLTGKKSWLH